MLSGSPSIVLSFIFLFLLGGCTAMKVEREVQSGRRALQLGDSKTALTHFQVAAAANPDYIARFTVLDIGIWTYVGMAQHEEGEKKKALASFQQAKQRHSEDQFAKVFLGLVESQNGHGSEAKRLLVDGLEGLEQWLETVRRSTWEGKYWDPGDVLAKAIAETLKQLEVEEINWRSVNDNVVWLARNFDEEIDEVKQDRQREGQDDDGDGGSRL